LENRKTELLDCQYFHVVFTVPKGNCSRLIFDRGFGEVV